MGIKTAAYRKYFFIQTTFQKVKKKTKQKQAGMFKSMSYYII